MLVGGIGRDPALLSADAFGGAVAALGAFGFLKSTRGRPFADQIGIPLWRLRQACGSDIDCIRQRQIEAISAYQAAGAPVLLPHWASPLGTSNYVGGVPAGGGSEPPIGGTGETIVPMVGDGGTFAVPVTINDQLTLKFVVDSGAADVSIPADVVLTLVRTETITDADFLGKQTYQMADGSVVPSQRFLIRSLQSRRQMIINLIIVPPFDEISMCSKRGQPPQSVNQHDLTVGLPSFECSR